MALLNASIARVLPAVLCARELRIIPEEGALRVHVAARVGRPT